MRKLKTAFASLIADDHPLRRGPGAHRDERGRALTGTPVVAMAAVLLLLASVLAVFTG